MKQIASGSSRQGLQLYTQTVILEQFSDVNRSRLRFSFSIQGRRAKHFRVWIWTLGEKWHLRWWNGGVRCKYMSQVFRAVARPATVVTRGGGARFKFLGGGGSFDEDKDNGEVGRWVCGGLSWWWCQKGSAMVL